MATNRSNWGWVGRTVQMPTLEALRTASYEKFHYGFQEGVFYFASAGLIRLLVALPDHGRERCREQKAGAHRLGEGVPGPGK